MNTSVDLGVTPFRAHRPPTASLLLFLFASSYVVFLGVTVLG